MNTETWKHEARGLVASLDDTLKPTPSMLRRALAATVGLEDDQVSRNVFNRVLSYLLIGKLCRHKCRMN